jgi:hypothetical protein
LHKIAALLGAVSRNVSGCLLEIDGARKTKQQAQATERERLECLKAFSSIQTCAHRKLAQSSLTAKAVFQRLRFLSHSQTEVQEQK